MPAVTPQTDPATAQDVKDFLHRAYRSAQDTNMALEVNFPAALINFAQAHPEGIAPAVVLQIAEETMLQLGLIDEGNFLPYVPAAWIMKAHAAGWRFNGGFYRLPQPIPFTLEEPK